MTRSPDHPNIFPFLNGMGCMGIRVRLPEGRTVHELARTIAALANSGGGEVVLCGSAGMDEVSGALAAVVPVPVMRTEPEDAAAERSVRQSLVIRPPEVAVRTGEEDVALAVTPGDSLCTVGGTVYAFEEGEVRPLSIAEVVKRLGSGG
ncbi:MAG: hypothetical protein PHP59_04355 [Methanofollis sp.]|uniref:hypothetical protein n=1 Tax=Methanofollis sp. TaxID=2052835 RepID=UPI002614F45D|nr:hypothetical protein [Methanofollis sp.]MDD4254591.1 hypothetical protein [Methanofollis sp.]